MNATITRLPVRESTIERAMQRALEQRYNGPIPVGASVPPDYMDPEHVQWRTRRISAWDDVRRIGHLIVAERYAWDATHSVVHQHESRAAQVLLKLTSWDHKPDIRRLEKDVADFMGQHLYKPLKDIEIGKLLNRLLELVSRHRLIVPPDIFLMMKALTTIEGVALM
ncbi:hypothetical protein LCGC14_1642490, partial [marine sediment metagenome]